MFVRFFVDVFIQKCFCLIFWFEMKSLFFCLIKRTKNQGCVIVVKAQNSNFLEIFAPMRFILFTPEFADFVGDLLQSFRQNLAFQFVHKTQQSQGH